MQTRYIASSMCSLFSRATWLMCAPTLLVAVSLSAASGAETPQAAESAKATESTKATEPAKTAEITAEEESTIRLIGATAIVTEVTTGIPLPARVDTGATSCSIHCEKFEIKGAAEDPKKNIGKIVRFLIETRDGKSKWVQAKIVDHVVVRTSEHEDERYKVRMRLRCEDVEKKVLVTLNDRDKMAYPLLLGRNFLRDDFLVNVNLATDGK